MAQYLLLLHADPTGWQTMPKAEQQVWFGKYMNWGQKARQEGFLLGSNKLMDESGKIIRGPKAVATDGPYSETKEWLGGYYLVEARRSGAALPRSSALAARRHDRGAASGRDAEGMNSGRGRAPFRAPGLPFRLRWRQWPRTCPIRICRTCRSPGPACCAARFAAWRWIRSG